MRGTESRSEAGTCEVSRQRGLAASALAVALTSAACSGVDGGSAERPTPDLITIADPSPDTVWDSAVVVLKLRRGCLLANGELVALPRGTRWVEDGRALQFAPEDEPVPLDGRGAVEITGNRTDYDEMARPGDLDPSSRERWDACLERIAPPENAEWWLVLGAETWPPLAPTRLPQRVTGSSVSRVSSSWRWG